MSLGATPPNSAAPQPSRRVVLLGASNVTRGFGVITRTAQSTWAEPLDLVFAMGRGRSFGRDSWFVARRLPGIVDCRLWQALEERPPLPTVAVVTDIGNDLLYDRTPNVILGWIETCLQRLAPTSEIALCGLPMDSLLKMRRGEFTVFRSLQYPRSRLPYETALARAHELQQGLQKLAAKRSLRFVVPPANWYGFDRIHIRHRSALAAWSTIFAGFQPETSSANVVSQKFFSPRWYQVAPHEQAVFGKTLRRVQPTAVLANGTRLSLY